MACSRIEKKALEKECGVSEEDEIALMEKEAPSTQKKNERNVLAKGEKMAASKREGQW